MQSRQWHSLMYCMFRGMQVVRLKRDVEEYQAYEHHWRYIKTILNDI